MFTRKDNEPYPLRVFWEHSEGQFVLVSKHRSGAVAERSFQAGLKRQPKDRSFVMDVRTGERKQYDGAGHTTGPFCTNVGVAWAKT